MIDEARWQMRNQVIALSLLTACSSSAASPNERAPANICAVHAANEATDPAHQVQILGTYVDDLIGEWGEPTSKSGNVWRYVWSDREIEVKLEPTGLCWTSGKAVSTDLWVTEMRAIRGGGERCWIGDMADSDACPGCIGAGDVMECSP